MKRIDSAEEISAVVQPSLLQRDDKDAGSADGAGSDQRSQEGDGDHGPALVNVSAGEDSRGPLRDHQILGPSWKEGPLRHCLELG
jgi:hypothetical protein